VLKPGVQRIKIEVVVYWKPLLLLKEKVGMR
jgi:hypothetical protein